ncbi:MAG TPA: MaoC family dehydratase [Anaeromyxobacteraceae bacterium]|nr:MaoC family dehydratase [Anaeromyxobacteraceae bacterium]
MARFAAVGEEITKELRLSPEEIARFSSLSGDENPLHHDEAHARGTRFGGIIASGTQTVAILMGLTATHFSRKGASLGLDFSFRLRKACRANDALRFRWRVERVEWKEKLGGELVFLDGEVRDGAGDLAITASALVLVKDRL